MHAYTSKIHALQISHRITKILRAHGDAQVASDQNLERTRVSSEETNCILSQFGMRNSWLARLCWQKHGTKGVAEHALQLKSIQHRHGSKSYDKFSYKIAHLIPRAINSQTRLQSADHQAMHCLCALFSDFVSLDCVYSTGNVSLEHSFRKKSQLGEQ